jgi:AraC family transcriptional activator of pyochelin receptor
VGVNTKVNALTMSSTLITDFSFEGSSPKAGKDPGAASLKNHSETWWDLPQEIAQGSLWGIELRPGFNLYCGDYQVKERFAVKVEKRKPAFGLGFCISGSFKGRSAGMPCHVATSSGQSQLFFFPDQTGIMVDERDTYHLSLSLIVEPEMLHALTRDEMDSLPPDFRRVVDGDIAEIYYHSTRVLPEMYCAFKQMMDCPYQGITRRLFLESKAIELLALRLEALVDSKCDNKALLNPTDIEKINHAAELLNRELKDPPSLFTLAKAVGLSHVKLNRGFRSLFGTTAFGYLRQVRLQNAKKLLETQQMNVTEAAFAVGYNSLSSFSRAFANQYGLQPHACNRNPTQSPFGHPNLSGCR